MVTCGEAITEMLGAAQAKDVPIRSWRITGKGVPKGSSGSDQDDALVQAEAAASRLPAGQYQLWLTESPKQLYGNIGGWSQTKTFTVSDFQEAASQDERLAAVLADNRVLRGRISELQTQYDGLQRTLTETSTQHAKAIAVAADGVAKTLEASVKGLQGLAEGHVDLLSSAKEILVASAQDARDQSLSTRAAGLWNRLWDPIVEDLGRDLGSFTKEVLPVAGQFLKWAVKALPEPKGEK